MATVVYLAPGPFGAGGQFFDSNGKVLNGGLINTYAAGSSTQTATYTTSAGTVQNANPIVLNSDGRPANEIWLIAGTSYKFTLTDSLSNLLGTYDNLFGIDDPSTASPLGVLTNVVGTNTITANASPIPSAYAKGQRWIFTAAATNSVAASLNIQSLGARNLMKRTSGGIVATVALDIISGNTYELFDDGTQLLIEGVRIYSQGANIASAATINLDTATGDYVHLTGAVTCTAITLAQGEERTTVTDGAMQFTNSASLINITSQNITSAAGDTQTWRGEAAGVVRMIDYRIAGTFPGKKPTRTVLTTGTAATYTTPTGATRLNVRMVGGGGGGFGSAGGGAGTASTFAGGAINLSAGGGPAGTGGGAGSTAAATASGGDINLPGSSGGAGSTTQPAGVFSQPGSGGASAFGGSGSGGASSAGPTTGLAGGTNTGGGGGGGGTTATTAPGGGGGSGAYCEKLITTVSATYTYTVGAIGTAGTSDANHATGGAGAAGIIIVDEYYD